MSSCESLQNGQHKIFHWERRMGKRARSTSVLYLPIHIFTICSSSRPWLTPELSGNAMLRRIRLCSLHISLVHRILEWFGLQGTLKPSSSNFFPWAGTQSELGTVSRTLLLLKSLRVLFFFNCYCFSTQMQQLPAQLSGWE